MGNRGGPPKEGLGKATAELDLSCWKLSDSALCCAQGRGRVRALVSTATFEGLPADLAEVGAALLVAAGHVPQQGPLLGEALLAEFTAEGPLASVGAVVLIQAGCRDRQGLSHTASALGQGGDMPASPCVRKVLPQRWHWKGFSPVCVRRCMLRLAFWVKAWLQNSQTYGLSFLDRRGTRAEAVTKGGRAFALLQQPGRSKPA